MMRQYAEMEELHIDFDTININYKFQGEMITKGLSQFFSLELKRFLKQK